MQGCIDVGEHLYDMTLVDKDRFEEMEVRGELTDNQGSLEMGPNSRLFDVLGHAVNVKDFLGQPGITQIVQNASAMVLFNEVCYISSQFFDSWQ